MMRMVGAGNDNKEDGWAEAAATRMVRAGNDDKEDAWDQLSDDKDGQGRQQQGGWTG